ncbi:MAG TPA: VanZ family protein [Thermoanaerobaculia bacterium]|nr:VanZ family protein [Thermoanaerobaculia bacterium]
MGKSQVHVVVVRKPVTVALLTLVTLSMIALLFALSGKAYAAETHPMREMLAHLLGAKRGPVSRGAWLAFLMPLAANMLLFVPWGFLAFVALDRPSRPRRATYLITVIGAGLLALAMVVWQQSLPTRVTSFPDTISNALGAFAGAALGHARKSVRIRFAI